VGDYVGDYKGKMCWVLGWNLGACSWYEVVVDVGGDRGCTYVYVKCV
jgi:hypothetical protein